MRREQGGRGEPESIHRRERRLPSFQYVDFTLSMTPDFPFRRVRPDRQLRYPPIFHESK